MILNRTLVRIRLQSAGPSELPESRMDITSGSEVKHQCSSSVMRACQRLEKQTLRQKMF